MSERDPDVIGWEVRRSPEEAAFLVLGEFKPWEYVCQGYDVVEIRRVRTDDTPPEDECSPDNAPTYVEKTCRTCRFWNAWNRESDTTGQCRVRPPLMTYPKWTSTDCTDFCGSWEHYSEVDDEYDALGHAIKRRREKEPRAAPREPFWECF